MLRLRPYKKCDAAHICSWIKDERTFRRWSVEKENEENHFEHVQSTGFDLYSLIAQLSDFYAPRRNIERKAGRERRKRALRKAKSVEA